MQISKRLKAVADMVTPGCRLADIGTDHAYIPIYLAQAEKISSAVAMDVNRGPLERAQEHIHSALLESVIETRLSDGLCALQPGEADDIVIAGMGGPLTVRILQEGESKLQKGCRLILQPQSDIREVRAYLEKTGCRIIREEIVCEEGKFYPMMKAVVGALEKKDAYDRKCGEKGGDSDCQDDHEAGLRYGALLIERCHPVLREYLLREQILNRRILASLEGQTGENAAVRRQEVVYGLRIIENILKKYGGQDEDWKNTGET